MIASLKELIDCSLDTSDGAFGRVCNVVLDARRWTVRFLVVETGRWSKGGGAEFEEVTDFEAEHVLVPFADVEGVDTVRRSVSVKLTRAQAERVVVDVTEPISSSSLATRPDGSKEALHFATEVFGCRVEAADGTIGHVSDLLVDVASSAIRSFVVAPHDWWFRPVFVSPAWIDRVQWRSSKVVVNHPQKEIREAPPRNAHAESRRDATNRRTTRQLDQAPKGRLNRLGSGSAF